LLNADDAYFPHQVDHIISRKRGGMTAPENLAYACFRCNVWKGSDIGSLHPQTGELVPLFNPRRDRWDDHFALRGFTIEPLTAQGEVTARLPKLNLDRRVAERRLLISLGRFPG
jgi:5-methylcytosine-specific restriction endonuclease McrA